MNNEIYHILNDMAEHLNIAQMKKLQEVLIKRLEETEEEVEQVNNRDYLDMFLAAKRIEGCSELFFVVGRRGSYNEESNSAYS